MSSVKRVGWRSAGTRALRENVLEPVPSFTEAHADYETVKLFLYAHSISKCDEQNILHL
jgi:hypothetical protein